LKKKKADLQISLFPFLSILACVIGILTLMITAIVIAQIDPDAVNEKIETALEDDEEFQIQIKEKKEEIEKLRQEIGEIRNNPLKKIDPQKKELLKKELVSLTAEAKKRVDETKKSKEIQGELVKVQSELASVMKNLEKAESEWELMKNPEKFATMVVKQSGSGMGGELEPTFIECRAEGVRVYEQSGVHFDIATAQIKSHAKLKAIIQKLVKEAPYRTWRSAQGSKMDARFVKREGSDIVLRDKKGKDIQLNALQLDPGSRKIIYKYEEARKAKLPDPESRYVIFLLRSKGFSSWYNASSVCQSMGCKFGQLPLDGEGEIDLSLFKGS
jgi:myosin heavy subunit